MDMSSDLREREVELSDLQGILQERSYRKALQRAVETIAHAAPFSSVSIMTVGARRRVHFEAWAEIDSSVIRSAEKNFNSLGLPSNLVDVIRTRKISVIEDLSTYPEWREPVERSVSWAGFPVLLHGHVIAIINVQTFKERITPAALRTIEPIVSTISLIVLRYQQERELTEQNRRLSVLYDLALAGSRQQDLGEMLQHVLRFMGRILRYGHVDILVYDAEREVLVLTANRGHDAGRTGKELDIHSPKGITVRAFRTLKPVLVRDTRKSREFLEGLWPARSELAIPLVVGDHGVGVFNLESHLVGAFTRSDVQLLTPYVLALAVLIDNAQKTRLLHDQVTHDGLTGFLNRRTMDETVAIELQRAARYHRDLSVIMLDLDEFKEVNDRLGHQEGDRLLRVFADCIRRLTRSSDAAFRYGGDEFLLMLPETSREGAEQFLARLNDVECPELETVLGHLTFSAGIATHFNDRQATDLIKRADDRLYQSKRLGSGRVTSH
jgi:diguanylate cyclase (GGDEF)-like protein